MLSVCGGSPVKISVWKLHLKLTYDCMATQVLRNKSWYRTFVLVFVGSFVAFHTLFPLRHFVLYKSNPSWTEEGHIGKLARICLVIPVQSDLTQSG